MRDFFCPSPIPPQLPIASPEIGTHHKGHRHSSSVNINVQTIGQTTIDYFCALYRKKHNKTCLPHVLPIIGELTRTLGVGEGNSAHQTDKHFINLNSLGCGGDVEDDESGASKLRHHRGFIQIYMCIYCYGCGNSQNTIQGPQRSVMSVSVCSRLDFPTNV